MFILGFILMINVKKEKPKGIEVCDKNDHNRNMSQLPGGSGQRGISFVH